VSFAVNKDIDIEVFTKFFKLIFIIYSLIEASMRC